MKSTLQIRFKPFTLATPFSRIGGRGLILLLWVVFQVPLMAQWCGTEIQFNLYQGTNIVNQDHLQKGKSFKSRLKVDKYPFVLKSIQEDAPAKVLGRLPQSSQFYLKLGCDKAVRLIIEQKGSSKGKMVIDFDDIPEASFRIDIPYLVGHYRIPVEAIAVDQSNGKFTVVRNDLTPSQWEEYKILLTDPRNYQNKED